MLVIKEICLILKHILRVCFPLCPVSLLSTLLFSFSFSYSFSPFSFIRLLDNFVLHFRFEDELRKLFNTKYCFIGKVKTKPIAHHWATTLGQQTEKNCLLLCFIWANNLTSSGRGERRQTRLG